jgi:hypothetical protein
MPRFEQVPELIAVRISSEDKSWLQERANKLRLRPAIYARILLSKAIELDRHEPGGLLR